MARLYDTALDGCTECREPLLDRLAYDSATTASLVEWVCGAIFDTYGSVPDKLIPEGNEPLGAPFPELVMAYCHEPDDEYEAMVMRALAMSPAQRRLAASTAIDTLLGLDPYGDDVPSLDDEEDDGPIIVATDEMITVIVPGPEN